MDRNWLNGSLSSLTAALEQDAYSIPISANLSVLREPVQVAGRTINNRLVIQPMEGCDGNADGTPTALTHRRYLRFAGSGAGIIWIEATAISPESRANPRQLMLTPENLDEYRRLTDAIRERAMKEHGSTPFLVLQATHSGRYSKPNAHPEPLIAYRCKTLESTDSAQGTRILNDNELSVIPEQTAATACLAEQAGFDAVDIKACHRYLLSELLSAYTRKGRYGGSYENRVRLLLDSVRAVKAGTQKLIVTSRLNLYDGYARPDGWGVKESGTEPDMTEPIRLVGDLLREGVPLINLTLGNPYFNPHVNRPYANGGYAPPEHPLRGVERACILTGQVKRAVPEMKIIASALSFMRGFAGYAAAGMTAGGFADFAGLGRMAFAYPRFADALLQGAALDKNKVCLTCSQCTELMRMGLESGCTIRDEYYQRLYQEAKKR